MDWDAYKVRLRSNLSTWFGQIKSIQSRSFDDDELLFQLNTNTLDAFSAMVDAYSSSESINEWLEKEKVRQKQKSLQTKMGDLHEIMIKSLKLSIHRRKQNRMKRVNYLEYMICMMMKVIGLQK